MTDINGVDVQEGEKIAFAYEHRYRVVQVSRIWHSKAGDKLVTGSDPDRDGDFRTFRVDRIENTPKKVK